MTEMITIFWEVLMPIFMLIGAGVILQKKFNLDLNPLTKVQLYLFIPSLIFIKIATSELEESLVVAIVAYTVVVFFVLMALSMFVAKIMKVDRKKEKAFINAVILRNQGNYGIPLITLAFASLDSPFPLSVHMIVMFTTNLLLNTVGLYNASSGTYTKKEAVVKVLKLPMIYTIFAGFAFNIFSIPIPLPVETTITLMSQAVVPLALVTLGAQLAKTNLGLTDPSVFTAVGMRLILSPVIAWLLTIAFGFTGTIAQVLILGAAAPSAVNSVLLAMEFNGDADYASETVFLSTLLSVITVTLTILIVL